MSHVFLESTKVGTTKKELLEILQEKVHVNKIEIEQSVLISTYESVCKAYAGIKRYSGEDYVTHTINVAIVLAELGAEANVVLAGMFCDVAKKGVVLLEDLRGYLPKEIYDIVIKVQETSSDLASAQDEVILIKLAERLHNMRTIEFIDEDKKQEKAKETIEVFMPLARRLDNKKLIDELNDLSINKIRRYSRK